MYITTTINAYNNFHLNFALSSQTSVSTRTTYYLVVSLDRIKMCELLLARTVMVLTCCMTAVFSLRGNLDRPRLISTLKDNLSIEEKYGTNFVFDRKPFKRIVQTEIWKRPELGTTFFILCGLESACRDISHLVRRVSTDNLAGLYRGSAGESSMVNQNVQGEQQKKLDVIANRILKQALCCSGVVSLVTSEEDILPCSCIELMHNPAFVGNCVAVIDPLDGSSNIDNGLPTGTIFGVYRNPAHGPIDPHATTMQRGRELVIAGYCLYSAATQLVVTMGAGVHAFTLDDVTGEFYLTRGNVRIPNTGSVYSFNDANADSWSPGVTAFLRDFKAGSVPGLPTTGCKPTARYFGALVADAHNILTNGGIFGYPACTARPNGKLRLLYEANPLAMIMQQAGGLASDGVQRILDVPVKDIHQRTPLYMGSYNVVDALACRYVKSV